MTVAQTEYTAAQYTEAIRRALAKGNVEAVRGLLILMAHEHPREAEELRQTILLGIAIADTESPQEGTTTE